MKYCFITAMVIIWCCVFGYKTQHTFITEKKAMTVVGKISSIPMQHEHGQSFVFDSDSGRLKLSWYNHLELLQLGQKWRLHVRLKPPHGYRNPGGFNIENGLLAQHINAVGYVVNKADNIKLSESHSLRANLLLIMRQRFHDNPYLDVVLAVSLGANKLLTQEHRQLFQRTGTSHLMAISGLHVGMVATLVFFFSGWLTRFYPRILRYIAKQKIASICALSAALGYSLLAGLSVSTERAMIMLTTTMLSYYFFAKLSLATALGLAFIVCLCVDPLAIYSASLWLSFCAVFVLLFTMNARLGQLPWFQSWGRAQWVCSFALIPLTAWYFHGFSALSMVSNIIAIPVVSFIVVPCSLFALLTIKIQALCALFVTISTQTLKYLLWLLQRCSFGYYYFALHNKIELYASLLTIAVMLLPKGLRVKHLVPVMFLPVLFPVIKQLSPGHFSLTVLDVGQGLSCVIRTRHHSVLFDTGPKFELFDSGGSIVVPYLKFEGIRQLDDIVVSHGDNDHAGGLDSIVSSVGHGKIYTSDQAAVHHETVICDNSIIWQYDGVQFTFLNDASRHYRKDNNNSCVLKVIGVDNSALLTGDIERRAEKKLAQEDVASTVIVVPHHGSRTSSSKKFIAAVNPKYAIFSYGFLNRFHHPGKQVVERYRKMGVNIKDTVTTGAVSLIQ